VAKPDYRSDEAREWRKLYKSARWNRLRQSVLDADPLCRYCLQVEIVEEAKVVDHIKPHKGDPELFWDINNLQPLCEPCHNGRKQREERGTEPIPYGVDGYPI